MGGNPVARAGGDFLELATSERPFLTAEWRYLAMLQYEVDPRVLRPFVPRGTELDDWHGRTLVSLVGFQFLDTRVMGAPIPFHRHFDEVNLRFYVRRRGPEGWRRAVVFLREIVPRQAIAAVARLWYNEPYIALPMRHRIAMDRAADGETGLVRYEWQHEGDWAHLEAETEGAPVLPMPGSEEAFISEHYWGYTAQRAAAAWNTKSATCRGGCGPCGGPRLLVTPAGCTEHRSPAS